MLKLLVYENCCCFFNRPFSLSPAIHYDVLVLGYINLLECPCPPPPAAPPALSQKPSHGDISETKRGIIKPLMSKRPEKIIK